MLKWTQLLLVIFLAMMPVMAANAQNEPVISFLEIDLWPEYDQPTMLVINKITLASSTSLPAKLDFRIPAAAGSPSAVAVVSPDGMLVNLDHELSSDGDWITISLVANLFELQIEYYDPNLIKNEQERNFTYLWPGDFTVQRSIVQVLQPFDASNLAISPGPTTSQTSNSGVYITKDVGALRVNQSFELEIAYSKESDVLGISTLPVQPSEPLTSEADWQSKMLGALPWVLGILGILLIAGGAFWYWQSGRQSNSSKPKRRRSRKTKASTNTATTAEGIYCHQCGKRAAGGDKFCRSCGTRLRME